MCTMRGKLPGDLGDIMREVIPTWRMRAGKT